MSYYGWLYVEYDYLQNVLEFTTTALQTLFPVPAAGKRNHIAKMSLSTIDTTVSVEVSIYSHNTLIWRHKLPFDGGNEPTWPHPIRGAINEEIQIGITPASSRVTVSANGYASKDKL